MFSTRCMRYLPHIKKSTFLNNQPPEIEISGEENLDPSFINIVTTPKSGTHLLLKMLHLLGVDHKMRAEGFAYAPHLCHYTSLLPFDFLDPHKLRSSFDINQKYIVTIRDPKDFLVSYIQWIDKEIEEKRHEEELLYQQASIQEKLDCLLTGGPNMKFKAFDRAFWHIGNYLIAEKLQKLNLPNILFLKFEDLIGPELGGNSKQKQIEAITKLCEFSKVTVTANKIANLIKLLPGNTLTYISQKKVGRWKEYFSQENIEIYKIRFSELEENLGYEPITDSHLIEKEDVVSL